MDAHWLIVCRDAGTSCDWEVRDSDPRELVAATQAHAARRHQLVLGEEQIRRLLRLVRPGVGGI